MKSELPASLFPEAVAPGRPYPLLADVRLHVWAVVAVAVSAASRWLVGAWPEGPAWARAAIALAPLVPGLLYVRSLARWIGGLDELQRRMQLAACLLSTVGALFLVAGRDLLAGAGLLAGSRLAGGFGWEGLFAVVVFGFIVGNAVVHRRYR